MSQHQRLLPSALTLLPTLLLWACSSLPTEPTERVADPALADADVGPYSRAQVLQRIADFAAGRADPQLRLYSYRGRPAYLLNSPCCDQFNYLYDAEGRILCAPSGGLSGRGDGRCTEPLLDPAAAPAPRGSGAAAAEGLLITAP